MEGELKVGRYRMEQPLGRGGMGQVFRAHDTRLGRTVALKMVPPELTHDAELRRRLAQEARAASALNHPGIATVYDFEEHPSETFIVFEYVEGVTLRERQRERRFSTDEILDAGWQLAEALAAAHERGVIHRDLKPENIMLVAGSGRLPRTKILDFGLAKIRKGVAAPAGDSAETATFITAPGLVVGTTNYLSPEQAEGEPADARSDLFALGLVLYEMAAGVNPFIGKSPASTIANILKLEVPPLSLPGAVVPAELDRIVRKCLRKHPEERYQSARELAVDLANLRNDSARPVSAAPVPPEQTLRESERPLEIPRGAARTLVAVIQTGYLAMYVVSLVKLEAFSRLPELLGFQGFVMFGSPELSIPLVLAIMLGGSCVRLYLLTAISLDYADLGRKYRRLFPFALPMDLCWSATPLLLAESVGIGPALFFMAAVAYLAFTQRPLIYSAYSPHGGRTSGIQISQKQM